jgi:hypothetical protein
MTGSFGLVSRNRLKMPNVQARSDRCTGLLALSLKWIGCLHPIVVRRGPRSTCTQPPVDIRLSLRPPTEDDSTAQGGQTTGHRRGGCELEPHGCRLKADLARADRVVRWEQYRDKGVQSWSIIAHDRAVHPAPLDVSKDDEDSECRGENAIPLRGRREGRNRDDRARYS